MHKKSAEAGFASVFLFMAVVGIVALMAFSQTQLQNQFKPHGEVQGVLIADKGDNSTSGGPGNSGTSGSPGGPSSDSGHGGPGPSLNQPPPGSNPSTDHSQGGIDHPTVGFGNNKVATNGAKPLPLPAFLNHQDDHGASESAELENEIEQGDFAHLTFRPNGLHLEIEAKDASGEAQTISEASAGGRLRIKLPGKGPGGSIEIEQTASGLLVISGGQTTQTNFPLSFDQSTGQLSVQLGDGTSRVIRVLPDQASEIAKNAGIESQLGQIQLASSSGTLIYRLQGQKTVKILGFIPVTIPVSGDVNAETGSAATDQPWWAKLFQ